MANIDSRRNRISSNSWSGDDKTEIGTLTLGATKALPLDKVDMLIPGVTYTFIFYAKEPIRDVVGTMSKIQLIEKEKRLGITYVQVGQDKVMLQVKPRLAFAPALIIGFLPLIGVAIVGIVAFIMLTGIPSWIYALFFLGLGLAFLLPTLKLQKFKPF